MKRLFPLFSHKNNYYNYDRQKKFSSRVEYYENKNCINSLDKLDRLVNPDISPHTEIESNANEIKPYNISFGSSIKKTKKRLGKPSFTLNNSEIIPKHYVLFYKTTINKYKLLIQIHFFDNKSFFICNQIYSSDELLIQDKKKIVNLIMEKYCDHPLDNDDTILIKLLDNTGNLIFTNDDISLYIFYLTGNKKFN